MSKYIPMDLAFEHYAHVKQDFNAQEYAKICREMVKSRYVPVTESEGYDLYFKGELLIPDKVRVIWFHDVERPNDNYLALKMAEMEHDFGFRTSYNLRIISLVEPMWREDLFKIRDMGHEFQYQHEDLVITGGDQAAAIESFKENMKYLRSFFPDVRLAFGHGVYKSGIDSAALVKDANGYSEELIKACGLPESGELYAFFARLKKELGDKFRVVGESGCLGGDEFAEALRQAKEGTVLAFLQHPTWWSNNYDFNELRYIMRESKFFH